MWKKGFEEENAQIKLFVRRINGYLSSCSPSKLSFDDGNVLIRISSLRSAPSSKPFLLPFLAVFSSPWEKGASYHASRHHAVNSFVNIHQERFANWHRPA
jgi:hypothetical protein